MFHDTTLPGVLELRPTRYGDDRGWLVELYSEARLSPVLGVDHFPQDNMSYSAEMGTIRGLHFQLAPHAQGKLITCLTGRILDVAVDLRPSSPYFGKSAALELSAEAGNQMFVPAGFAHGFCTLTDDCRVQYKLSSPFAPDVERSIAFDDPALGIDWPFTRQTAHLSERDATAACFADVMDGLSDGDVV